MPHYVKQHIKQYGHKLLNKPQHTPLRPAPRKYEASAQEPEPPYTSSPLDAKDKKFVERVVGSFLYYGRAVDPTILHALSTIASEQANPTQQTLKKVTTFLNYMAIHPESIIRFYKFDMILQIHSDASYLTALKSRSRAGGHFFLGSVPFNNVPIKLNGTIHYLCKILRFVASSAEEAELGALFLNAREAKILCITLHELGHP